MAKKQSPAKAKDYQERTGSTQVMEDTQAHTPPQGDMIAEAAYYKAEKRGFIPGHEMQDWLEAEQDIKSRTTHH
jgi:hypothetical protein